MRVCFLRASIALAIATFPMVSPPAAAQTEPTAFVGGTLVDGRGGPPIFNTVIVFHRGRILCVGSRAACSTAGALEINITGQWVIPGLVDAHVHYSQTGWADGRPDSYDARSRFPYEEVIAARKDPTLYYRSYLCSGVTATYDVGGYPWTWGLRAAAERSASAPHVAAAGPLLSTRDHWLNLPAERQFLFIGSDSATEAGARYLLAHETDAIKIWFLAGEQTADRDVLAARMRMAGRMAAERGTPLIVHATGLWQAKEALRAGAHLLVHGVRDRPVDEEFLALAKRNGTFYNPTMVVSRGYAQLRARRFDSAPYDLACVDPATRAKAFLTDSLPDRPSAEQLEQSAADLARSFAADATNLMRVHRAGIPVVVGTDAGNPLTLHGPAIFLEMEAMQAAGLTPMEVLVAATWHGARAMGREQDFGSIEAGKIADLVVLAADPTADITNARRIMRVVRNGRVYDRRELEYRD